MNGTSKRIVIAGGVRTAIGHLAKSLATILPEDLMGSTIRELMNRSKLDPSTVDGVMVGWVGQGSHAPNVARIAALKAGRLPEKAHCMTVQANCVSGLESICTAARHIILGEGEVYIAGGTESMSNFPYAIRGPRSAKPLRSLQSLKENWDTMFNDPQVEISDTMEEGLNDPVKNISMAATAEVCAQMFGITREEQDKYAHTTFKRCYEAEQSGFYSSHVMPVRIDGNTILEKDEYVMLRKSLIEKPEMISKAPVLFDSEQFRLEEFYKKYGEYIEGKKYSSDAKATVTLFNACARSDGAAAVIVTTYEKAKALGLEILGEIKGWSYYGINPAHMGISPAYASQNALERANVKFSDLSNIELHEAFAATCLSIFKVSKEKFGQDWRKHWDAGTLNPHGGSIPLGHPLAATGTRIVLNLIYALRENTQAKLGLATACAAGGLGGAMVIEKI